MATIPLNFFLQNEFFKQLFKKNRRSLLNNEYDSHGGYQFQLNIYIIVN